jgi:sulfate adenylyltransferase subunit 1
MIKNILYKVDINTLHRIEGDQQIVSNDIARITLRTTQPLFIDSYSDNKSTGSIIIIDEATNNTVGAGMII